MSAPDTAREHLTQQRQHQQQIQQAMLERSEAEIAAANGAESQAEVRASLTAQRQKHQHLEDSMKQRSAAEINPSDS